MTGSIMIFSASRDKLLSSYIVFIEIFTQRSNPTFLLPNPRGLPMTITLHLWHRPEYSSLRANGF
jgi:hypothetical protein